MEGEILGAGSEGAVAGAPVNQTVSDSWDRCWQAGLNRSDKPRSAVLLEPELRIRREQNQELWKLAQTELQELFTQVAGANYVVAFADRTGTILEAIHDQEFLVQRQPHGHPRLCLAGRHSRHQCTRSDAGDEEGNGC